MEAAQGRWRPFLITAVFTGLRASELRGLRWTDVDLKASRLHVRQRADRYHAIGMPKSDSGQRSIPLPPIVVNTIREWRLACPKGKLGLVFPNGAGRVESLANITNRGLAPTMVRAARRWPRPSAPCSPPTRHKRNMTRSGGCVRVEKLNRNNGSGGGT